MYLKSRIRAFLRSAQPLPIRLGHALSALNYVPTTCRDRDDKTVGFRVSGLGFRVEELI